MSEVHVFAGLERAWDQRWDPGYNRGVALSDPVRLDLRSGIDVTLAEVPEIPAVFLIWPESGAPYFARTSLLRRRLRRLLGERAQPSRALDLRRVAQRLEYWPVRSSLGGQLTQLGVVRTHFPDEYEKLLKLRRPSFVRLLLGNPYPRLQVTTRFSSEEGVYGPFLSRAAAEQFEAVCLDQFQLRRCLEDLHPAPSHPGCVYGEMQRCLRPCQLAVSKGTYREEAQRVREYLSTGGQSLLAILERAREAASADLDFEEAARLHGKWERAQQVLPGSGELARLVDRLHGIAVVPTSQPDLVELWPVSAGQWQAALLLPLEFLNPAVRSLDVRLRELFEAWEPVSAGQSERADHLALLSRWFHSTWRDGEWLAIEDWQHLPYRKLVNAIGRVSRKSAMTS